MAADDADSPLPAPRWVRHTAQLPHPDGGGVAYVLGTAHISAASAEEAAALIRDVRPASVRAAPSRRARACLRAPC